MSMTRLCRRLNLALCLTLTLASGDHAVVHAQVSQITNATVIELVSAGVSADTIALIVRASASAFDTSDAGLAELLRGGVPEAVIAAILRRPARAPAENATGAVREVAFALENQDARGVSLIAMDEAPHTSAMSYGLFSAGMKVIVPGKNARVEALEGRPSFRVELPAGRKPTEFILSKLEDSDEGGARQINPESSELFDVERISDGVYRLTPREELRRGEYCFYVTGSSGPSAIYDFRIIRR